VKTTQLLTHGNSSGLGYGPGLGGQVSIFLTNNDVFQLKSIILSAFVLQVHVL